MSEQNIPPGVELADNDKLTPVMLYTSHSMVWGQLYSKEAIRVSTWLHTDMVPSYFKIYEANVLMISGSKTPAPLKIPTLYLQTKNINAFHLMPPFAEGADYDPDEPNRKMVPTAAFVGYFRFDGFSRMAEFTTMDNYLGALKGEYTSIYDITMTCPMVPSIKGIEAPMVLLRQERVSFAAEDS
jgi:hypothetical protein